MRHVVYCILLDILLTFCVQSVKGLEEFGVAWMYVAWWVLSGVGQAYEKLLLQLDGVVECNVINFLPICYEDCSGRVYITNSEVRPYFEGNLLRDLVNRQCTQYPHARMDAYCTI